jgi:hypothetical protein
VTFEKVSLDDANKALNEMEERIRRFKEGISIPA